MIVTQSILQMGITTPRQVSRHVQLKTNVTAASNLPPQMNLRHMRNNMLDRCGHVLSVIKSQRAMTNTQFTSTIGPIMKGGICTSALLTHAQLMATHLGMTSSTWSGGIYSPLGCPKCEGKFCSKQSKHKHIPTCLGKRINLAPNRNSKTVLKMKNTTYNVYSEHLHQKL